MKSDRSVSCNRNSLVLLLCLVAPALGEEAGKVEGPSYAWILALGLTLVHLVTPMLKPTIDRHGLELGSFGGGAAISYLFLHLLPELDEDNQVLRGHIYGVVLLGFIVVYGLKVLNEEDEHRSGRLAIGQACVYSWLLTYGLASEHMGDFTLVILGTLALSGHLMHEDHEMAEEYPNLFRGKSRLLLAFMPLLGLVSRTYLSLHQEVLKSLVTAVLAGIIMYNSFADGLPSGGNPKTFRWFTAGAVLYGGLAVLIRYMGG